MTPDRADWHLTNWSVWMCQGSYASLKVRLMSAEAGRSYGSQDFDNMAEASDVYCARVTNAVVSDLPDALRRAVHAWYLEHPWLSKVELSPLVSMAREQVGAALERKGVV